MRRSAAGSGEERNIKERAMKLTDEDKRKLDGKYGPAVQHAMEHLVKFGEAFEAEEMVDCHSAHIFSDYRTIGDGGLAFYQRLVDMGAKMGVMTTCEPISMDLKHKDEFNWPDGYEEKQNAIIDCLRRMNVVLTYTCTPYLTQNLVRFGENIAWIEGNATGFANSLIGARGNREDSVNCPMASITKRIPKHGMLDPRNRVGSCLVKLDPELMASIGGEGAKTGDFEALGAIIGDFAYDRIPVVTGMPLGLGKEEYKALSAACSPAMTTTLLLYVGVSPEAPTVETAFGGKVPKDIDTLYIDRKALRRMYEDLSTTKKSKVDVVVSGCPFKTIEEIREVADLLGGRKVKSGVKFYIHTDHPTYSLAEEMGLVSKLETAGALLTRDTCEFCMPIETMFGPEINIATDSMKMRRLVAGEGKPSWRYGTLANCVDAAVTGEFELPAWN
jgi:predicted aconitase